ncbi:MAG: Holliday junction branch migration protein RuvA [Chloroflexi bacterium]|nr:Holliday junction branch migration protein RuvA [Chloroflexota bacterium]
MIASLRGQLEATGENTVVLDVGGVGYLVHVSRRTLGSLPALGQTVALYTQMILREDDVALYGFASRDERELFAMLLTASGVGPRTAMAALGVFAPETLRTAIASGDADALMRIPGIGRKTAQRLVLDLKDKVGVEAAAIGVAQMTEGDADVVNALTALGYSVAEAQTALGAIPGDVTELDQRILLALRYLGSR